MPIVSTEGIDALIRNLENRSKMVEKNGRKAVKAAGAVLEAATKQTAPVRAGDGHGHELHVRDAIKAHAVRGNAVDGFTCEVYPSGNRDDGQRFQTVAFVLEYGTSQKPGTGFMRKAADQAAESVGQTIANELMKGM